MAGCCVKGGENTEKASFHFLPDHKSGKKHTNVISVTLDCCNIIHIWDCLIRDRNYFIDCCRTSIFSLNQIQSFNHLKDSVMRIFGSLFSSQRLVFFLFFVFAICITNAPCQIADFPFLEAFEEKQLSPCWKTWSSDSSGDFVRVSNGPIILRKQMPVYYDSLYVRNSPNLNELTLSVDMAGQSGVYLSFLLKGDTDTQTVPESFTGHYDGNAVAISPDGINWHRAVDLSAKDCNNYEKIVVNIDSIVDLHQISYTTDFKVRFMQYNDRNGTDIIRLDSIHIYTPENNRVVFHSNGNGSVITGDTLPVLSGLPYQIQAQPDNGHGFLEWRVISGDVVIEDPFKKNTECSASEDAVVEAVFKEGTRVYEVGHDETTFSFLSHAYAGRRSNEIRFKYTRRSDERLSVCVSGQRWVHYYLSHQLYGKDSTYSDPIDQDSLTALRASHKTILLDPGSEGDTHYFSIFYDYRWAERETFSIKVNPINKMIIDTSRGGSAEFSSIYGLSGDRFTVEALPLQGYRFKDWEILDGESIIEKIDESEATIRIESDSRIRPVFQKDSTTIEEIQASEKTEIVVPPLQNSIRLKIADCDSGNYAVRFDWKTPINGAGYDMHDTDSTFENIVDILSSRNRIVGLPLHVPYRGKTFYMTVKKASSYDPCTVEVSLEKLHRCSTIVSGGGTIFPSHPLFTSAILPHTIKAVAQDPNTSFKCWEVVSGDGILSDRYNPQLTFYGSTDLVLKAVFESRNITQLQTGSNVVSAAPEQTSKYFDLVYETSDSGNYLLEVKYSQDLKYYGQDSTFADVLDTNSKRIHFYSSIAGQKHHFRLLPLQNYYNRRQAIAFIDRACRIVIDTSDLQGGTAKVTDEFMYKGEITGLEAVADANYSFSHFEFLSGIPQIEGDMGINTRITVLSDLKCRPVFTKNVPFALQLNRQTISMEQYCGLSYGSPIRLKFTAPESGWYSFRHNLPTLDRFSISKLIGLKYYGEDSTYTLSDTSLYDAINQVVFYSDKGKTTHLELVGFSYNWSPHESIVMDVDKFFNLEPAALPGGRLERTDHFFGINDVIYINAAPENGCTFDSWFVDDSLTQILNPRQKKGRFIFNSDTRISARFQDTIPTIPVSSELPIRFSGNSNLKYIAPQKGHYSFNLTAEKRTNLTKVNFFYNDSTYSDLFFSETLGPNSDAVRFYADSAGQILYFNLLDRYFGDYIDTIIRVNVKPLYACLIFKDRSDNNGSNHVKFSGPDVPCTLKVQNQNPRKKFVRWNVLSGTGDLLCDTSHKTVLNAHSDMVIEALYEEKEGYILSEQKLVLPWTILTMGDEAIELKYRAPEPGAYTLTLESRIDAMLRYHGTDSTLMHTMDNMFYCDTIDYTFTAKGGDDHFFTMFRFSTSKSSIDSFNLYIQKTWQCLFAERENGRVSIADTSIVIRNDTLSLEARTDEGDVMEEIRLLEGQASIFRKDDYFYVVPESNVLIEPVFTVRDYQYETFVMGNNTFKCSPPFTYGNSPYYTSRFSFNAPADGTYRISTDKKVQAVYQITCFDQDSAFSRKSDVYQLTSNGPGCLVTCKGGSKTFFELNSFNNKGCSLKNIYFSRCHKVRIIETDGGWCFPSEEFFVTDSSSSNFTAVPRDGYQFKGWYTISGSDTVFVSERNAINPRIISDSTFYATFSKYSIHTVTTKDTVVTMSSNKTYEIPPIRGERFRFVAPDTGQFIFCFNYNSNNYPKSTTCFYGKDSTFYNLQSSSSDRRQDWFHHSFWAENPGDTLYFQIHYSSSLPADVTVAAKKGYQVEFAVQGEGRLDPVDKVIVPHDQSFSPQVTIRPDPGYRLEKWVITEGNVRISDSLSNTIDVSASGNGKVTAVLQKSRWFDLTSEPTGYSLKKDYYSAESGCTIRFRYSAKDTGMHSIHFPRYNKGFHQTAYYFGADSSCITGAAVERITLNSKPWINFRVTDPGETLYFAVNGYPRQFAEDFQVQVVKPYKVTVESENGTITVTDSYVPSGEITRIEAIPDYGYGFEQWDLVTGEATLSDRNSAICRVTVLTDCFLRATYRQPGAYELTSDFTEYSFAQNSYCISSSVQEISFFFQPSKNGEYTLEMKEGYMPGRPYVTVSSSDTSDSLAGIGRIGLPYSYKIDGKKGSTYSFKVQTINYRGGRFFIRVKGDDQTAIQNNGPQRPMVIYTEGGLIVAPNPVGQDRATCDLYLKAPFSGNAKLRIFDAVGNEIAFFRDYVTASRQTPSVPFYRWNLRNRNGRKVAPGTYLAVVTVEGIGTKKYMCKIGIKN